jgi:hypothetical protein
MKGQRPMPAERPEDFVIGDAWVVGAKLRVVNDPEVMLSRFLSDAGA